MRTCVTSFFDSLNLGDLLIADRLYQVATEYGPAERISFSGDPFHYPSLNAVPGPAGDPAATSSLRARVVATRTGHAVWRAKEVRSTRHASIRDVLGRADLQALGGGNMVFDLDRRSRSSDRFRYFVDTARRASTPTFGISLGIGPFATVRQHRDACRALDRCRWLTFRDRASLDLYREHGRRSAQLGIDPVLLLDPLSPRAAHVRHRVALNVVEPRLLGTDGTARRSLIDGYARVVRRLLADGCGVDLFTTDRADERLLAELEAAVSTPGCRWRGLAGLADLRALYDDVDVVVAGRMHALIIAFTQDVPIVGLVWQTKVRALFELIDKPEHSVELLALDEQALHGLVEAARSRPSAFAITPEDRVRLRARDEVNHEILSARADEVSRRSEL